MLVCICNNIPIHLNQLCHPSNPIIKSWYLNVMYSAVRTMMELMHLTQHITQHITQLVTRHISHLSLSISLSILPNMSVPNILI